MIFKKSNIKKKRKIAHKSMKNRMFFWSAILEAFWEGFGKPKSSIFALFSMFFRCHFSSALRKAKKSRKNAKKSNFSAFWRRVCGGPQAGGERKGKGKKHFRSNCAKECRDWPAVIRQSQLEMCSTRRWHTFGGRRIETPQGGPPPPPQFGA